MDIEIKRKLLKKIVKIESEIEQLKDIRSKLASSEFASATMSSGSGSRSYTRMDVGKISETISTLQTELKNTRKLLKE